MFNKDFFPTPLEVIEIMTEGETIQGKVILEPSGGKGNIVDYLLNAGAKDVIACENNEDLKKILQTKCKIIENDFLTLTSDRISHIDCIIMNPPFSADDKHILHAYEIAPAGCKIISLCNLSTIENLYTNIRKELKTIIDIFGSYQDLGDCFADAERKTGVKVGLIKIQKAGTSYKTEFEGFFMDEEPDEKQENGIMSYNVVRDLVNRYVGAVKIFDEQLNAAVRLNNLLGSFYGSGLAFQCTENDKPKQRAEFKKDMQRAGWKFIFNKMDLKKHTTRGLMEDINKFVEQQSEIPFTMKNIYHMLDMVVQTTGQRMDKALLEVFDKVTGFHDDNKKGLPGWKTNSHYLLTKRFIHPYLCPQDSFDKQYYPNKVKISYNSRADTLDDMVKAICYLTADNYDNFQTLDRWVSDNENTITFGQWFDWAFFRVRAYKKGTMHFEFKDAELWGKFNQRIAKLKGYPLFEGKEQTAYQNRQTGRATQQKANLAHAYKPTILTTIKLKKA